MAEECKEIFEVAEGPSVCAPVEQEREHPSVAVQQEATYGIKIWIQKPYDEVLESTRKALAHEGFGVVTEIAVHKLFQEKLGMAFPRYQILGVCNPEWAHQALDLDRDIGLLLPCNVIVYEQSDGTVVEAVDPIAMMALAGGEDLQRLARTVKRSLQTVINHVASGVN